MIKTIKYLQKHEITFLSFIARVSLIQCRLILHIDYYYTSNTQIWCIQYNPSVILSGRIVIIWILRQQLQQKSQSSLLNPRSKIAWVQSLDSKLIIEPHRLAEQIILQNNDKKPRNLTFITEFKSRQQKQRILMLQQLRAELNDQNTGDFRLKL